MTDTMAQPTPGLPSYIPPGANGDAQAAIDQYLQQFGLQGLAGWAWDQITSGATANQVLVNLYSTTQFKQRFPGITIRQQAGLPPISPAQYVAYEDQAKQMETQYGLPTGFLTNPGRIAALVGGDVSAAELGARLQQGYQQVAYAPPEVRQAFTGMFGANGDGALAAHFLDPKTALPLLEQQATAADIMGTGAIAGANMSSTDAMKLAQMGTTPSGAESAFQKLQSQSNLFTQQVGESNNGLTEGQQGVEAAFGLNAGSAQQVAQAQQQRIAEFSGGGNPYSDQYGESAGAAKHV